MLHDLIFFAMGLALIIFGANYVTDGASDIARRLGVSDLIIGLTVVALGSSTPDLVVCLTSTISGHSQLAIGDVLGANLFDVLLVMGIVALVKPFPISRTMTTVDLPMLVLSSLVLAFCADDALIDRSANVINRSDGLMLLALFVIYMRNSLVSARLQQGPNPPKPPMPSSAPQRSFLICAVMVVGGLAALIVGGNWIVDGASGIAKVLGMSESLIGLTVVAFCGAAPDLATALVAAYKGKLGIALGSTVGGCIMNVFMCLGLTALIRPVDASGFSTFDFATLAGGSVLLWLFACVIGPGKVTRLEGTVLVLCYVAYMAATVLTALH